MCRGFCACSQRMRCNSPRAHRATALGFHCSWEAQESRGKPEHPLISEEAGSWQGEDLPGAPLLVGSEMGL